ncbi:MAG: YitT family protein, partial [Bacteroidales bacterium]|nr:YitT family protein [Bacteroidales bacterium]
MEKILKMLCTSKFWMEFVIMTVGIFIAAIAVYYFLVPSKLIIGTISGLSIVLHEFIPLPLGTLIFLINAVLLVLAYFLIGHEFGVKTVYTALLLGPFTDLLDKIAPWQKFAVENHTTGSMSVMGDPWFDLLCFVLILSASQAVLFSINCSTGGLDILAKIVNKYLHFDIGKSVTIAGGVICCTAFLINPFRMVVIGLIGTWINGIIVDYFTASLNNHKRVCVVSKEWDRIRNFIINDLHRGCTLYEVIGGYTNEKSIELEALLSKDEFSALMAYINNNNISAFTTAGNVSEVYGFWNKNKKKTKKIAEK